MKNFISKSVILFVLIAFLGCSSDSSTPSTTACVPIKCYNGGASTSVCGCDCPTGYTGIDCFSQKTPIKVLITKIRVLSFANKDSSNSSWDALGGEPDIYVKITKGSAVLFDSNYISNAISNNTNIFDFTPITPIELLNVGDFYKVELWDYDGKDTYVSADDYMDGKLFVPFIKPSSLPKSIIVQDATTNLKIEIFITYVF